MQESALFCAIEPWIWVSGIDLAPSYYLDKKGAAMPGTFCGDNFLKEI